MQNLHSNPEINKLANELVPHVMGIGSWNQLLALIAKVGKDHAATLRGIVDQIYPQTGK